ncbi:MAG: hypothetical protein KGH64_06410 [Candidatus Micrarchaeota archaeon]|nr:hypothetical protein [Candidatus Micrarchaeota archaeon]MDE1834939.1 hypothetical protein [Candidatus Micrarchaeota archaeon]MDE1858899.1 hypothetical protein [Candidatus Micrarchaeota archaeon]
MDRRQIEPEQSGFLKDLNEDTSDYNDIVEYKGKHYRVPYKMVKEMVVTNLSKQELIDIEHTARLQYRLLLIDSILKAKIEFIHGKMIIIYNPKESPNRKDKISTDEIIQFLAKEGVHVDRSMIAERDVDYFEEIYKPQFEPATIREHAPYGYTLEEWRKIKPEWIKQMQKSKTEKWDKFRAFQDSYLEQHPELWSEYGFAPKGKKLSLMDRILGRKANKDEKEKGFWFHGV